ncbi:dienelactone hydrolase family protein [Treponema pectinovorum]|uniref:dienelactone hydrolase family protein n=1 Tax=Treponema pectinovorum TaxID=164 RepID=UPI0011C8C46B|nr:alpha/beta fold hydrolase [Treponema pectinovorum]
MKKLLKRAAFAVFAVFFAFSSFAEGSKEYVTQEINASSRCLPTFYENIKSRWTFKMGYKDGVDVAQWKKDGLAKARELIIQEEDNTPFDMVVIATEKRDGYTAQKVVFNISKDSRVLAYLLVPNGKKNQTYPAALMLHDHGSKFVIGKEKMVKPFGNTEEDKEKLKNSDAWSYSYFSKLYPGDELAKRGYVVLSFDALGWGDRSVKGFATDSQQSLASNLFNMGTSFAGIIAQEDCRAAKFLASLPQVDKKRVAALGFSMGGFRSWQLAAISDDITAGISVCWFGTMKGHIVEKDGQLKGNSAYSMLHPTIAKFLDYPDVAGLAAPKPMYFINGDVDPVNPVAGIKEGYEKIQKIWAANNAQDKLKTEIFAGHDHSFPVDKQKSAFDWLDAQFGK